MAMTSEFGHLDEVCDKPCTRHKFGRYACAVYNIVIHVVYVGGTIEDVEYDCVP